MPESKARNRRYAVLDLGSNTFHLIIGEKSNSKDGFDIIFRKRVFVYLSKEGLTYIDTLAIDRALSCLLEMKAYCDKFMVDTLVACGTAIFREASNAIDLIKIIYDKINLEIRVLSAKEEAHYIFLGNQSITSHIKDTILTMDIGGGSVEYILGQNNNLIDYVSINIGISELRAHWTSPDRLSEKESVKINNHISNQLNDFYEGQTSRPTVLLGSSGPFEILQSIAYANHGKTQDVFFRNDVMALSQIILGLDKKGRNLIKGMPPNRADLSKESFLLISHVLQRWQSIEYIHCSPFTMKEGILKEVINLV